MTDKRTILLYGRTNAGKTAQIGQLAEHIFIKTGKRTRLYTADKGGTDTIKPYLEIGLIDPVVIAATDPWIFLNKAVNGFVRDSTGKWVKGDLSDIGLVAFESFRSFAEELLSWQGKKASEGVNIGGGSNISFQATGDGETLKIGGSNQAHYKVAQDRMTEEIWQSLKLDVPYVLWTSSVSKDDDASSSGKVLGPDVIGKALTAEVPRWFNYTYRLDVLPAANGKKERHILYLGNSIDSGAGNATGLGNTRTPLDATPIEAITIEPASITKALELIQGGQQSASEAIKKRLGDKVRLLTKK